MTDHTPASRALTDAARALRGVADAIEANPGGFSPSTIRWVAGWLDGKATLRDPSRSIRTSERLAAREHERYRAELMAAEFDVIGEDHPPT